MATKRVLSVGQCAADQAALRRLIESAFGATVVPAATAAQALAELRRQAVDLVLVNRVLDADGSSGLDLLEQIRADESLRRIPVMLVSDRDDAQQQAQATGACPGFGKAELDQSHTLARLRAVLG
jgi:CheY-like chemotaxis protein